MKTKLFYLPILAAIAMGWVLSTSAETKIEISASNSDFEIVDADVSHLAIGESEIIYADDKEITLTRTESGIEVLVDGENLDTDFASIQAECNVEINIEANCDDCEEGSQEMTAFLLKTSTDTEEMQVSCFSGDSDSHYAWESEDGSQHITRTIDIRTSGDELHTNSEHKIIMIKKYVEVVNEEG